MGVWAYSVDLRERVVAAFELHGSRDETTGLFRWCAGASKHWSSRASESVRCACSRLTQPRPRTDPPACDQVVLG